MEEKYFLIIDLGLEGYTFDTYDTEEDLIEAVKNHWSLSTATIIKGHEMQLKTVHKIGNKTEDVQ